MIIRTLAVGALAFAIIHTAHAQDYPYSRQQWVQREDYTTAYLQHEADEERLRANARLCARLVAHHPSIDVSECIGDPTTARNLAIAQDNARREAVYRAQMREHERQIAIYARQQAEYQRQLARWHAQQQHYPGYPEY